jgi:2-C-methyl-D-erythritol 4-phosphate cytidylyltransferase
MSFFFSDKNVRIWIVVPAAGIGTRMGSELPKQYLQLGEQTILEHTLERLLQLSFAQNLVLALHPEDSYWPQLSVSNDPRITRVTGGEERAVSVSNALRALATHAQENDWVLVHDAARPCVTHDNIYVLCRQVERHSVGGILAVPVSDTLKKTDAQRQIVHTIDRTQVWQAQTPQLFRYGLLRDCLESAFTQAQIITDEASAVEAAGYQPLVVPGRSDNIKITQPQDLLLAQWILQQQDQHL